MWLGLFLQRKTTEILRNRSLDIFIPRDYLLLLMTLTEIYLHSLKRLVVFSYLYEEDDADSDYFPAVTPEHSLNQAGPPPTPPFI